MYQWQCQVLDLFWLTCTTAHDTEWWNHIQKRKLRLRVRKQLYHSHMVSLWYAVICTLCCKTLSEGQCSLDSRELTVIASFVYSSLPQPASRWLEKRKKCQGVERLKYSRGEAKAKFHRPPLCEWVTVAESLEKNNNNNNKKHSRWFMYKSATRRQDARCLLFSWGHLEPLSQELTWV